MNIATRHDQTIEEAAMELASVHDLEFEVRQSFNSHRLNNNDDDNSWILALQDWDIVLVDWV